MDDFRLSRLLLPAYAPAVSASTAHGAMLTVLALHSLRLGATAQQAALVVAAFGLGSLVSSLPSGSLVAKYGERRSLVVAGIFEATAMVVAWRTQSLIVLAAAVALSGATWSVFMLARQSYLIDVVPPEYRARAMSLLGGSHRVGLFVGPMLATPIISHFGLQQVFVASAALALLAAVLALQIPNLKHDGGNGESVSLASVLKEHLGTYASIGSAVLIISSTRSIRLLILPLWADHAGLAAERISLMMSVSALAELALFYPSGWIMDRFGRTWVAGVCVGVIGLGITMLPLAHTFALITVFGVGMGIGNGLSSGIVMTLGADNAPLQGRQQFLGGWRLASDLGNSGGPAGLSLLVGAFPLATACVVSGGLTLLAAGWTTYWVNRSEERRLSRP